MLKQRCVRTGYVFVKTKEKTNVPKRNIDNLSFYFKPVYKLCNNNNPVRTQRCFNVYLALEWRRIWTLKQRCESTGNYLVYWFFFLADVLFFPVSARMGFTRKKRTFQIMVQNTFPKWCLVCAS